MTETRRVLSELAYLAAQTLPVWRDTAIVVLALVVIGCLVFMASVWGD